MTNPTNLQLNIRPTNWMFSDVKHNIISHPNGKFWLKAKLMAQTP